MPKMHAKCKNDARITEKLRKTKKLMIKVTENYEKKQKKQVFFLLFLIFIFYCDNDILKS